MPLIVYCRAASSSLSDSVSYITVLFSEWHIRTLRFENKIKVLNTLVREPNPENCLDFIFAAPLVRKLSLYQIQIYVPDISHLQSENSS